MGVTKEIDIAGNTPVAHAILIRECGFNELWLQDQIIADTSCLGLGELEVITRERQQASGGRLDKE